MLFLCVIVCWFSQLSSDEASFRRERLYVNKLNIILVQVIPSLPSLILSNCLEFLAFALHLNVFENVCSSSFNVFSWMFAVSNPSFIYLVSSCLNCLATTTTSEYWDLNCRVYLSIFSEKSDLKAWVAS